MKRLITGILLLAVLTMLAGCVSRETFESVQQELSTAEETIADQQAQITELGTEVDRAGEDLDKVNEALKAEQGRSAELTVSLEEADAEMEEAQTTLGTKIIELEGNYEILQGEYKTLFQEHENLLTTLDMIVMKDFTQVIEYSIPAGTDQTWTFVLPSGVLWDAKINFSPNKVWMEHAWRWKDERVFVGASSRTFSYLDYGEPTTLSGTITVDYYYGDRGGLWVTSMIRTQFPEVQRQASHFFEDLE